ncbi:hypothetical protein ACHAW6_000674 [Cyclotella cf. meneghiniana]
MSWTLVSMRSIFQMAAPKSGPQIPSLRQYMPSATLMVTSSIHDHLLEQVKVVNGKKLSRGCELCCEWKDGSTSWLKLSDLKESDHLQVAEITLAVGIANEPANNWWVTWVFKKRERIMSLIHKFKIELPKTVNEAYTINKAIGTTFQCNTIELEMKSVQVAFDVLPDGVTPPSDQKYMKCYMIFNVNIEDSCHKSRFVVGGRMTRAPATLTYASILSHETEYHACSST